MEEVIVRGFNATKRLWDAGSKQWVEEPDMRSQLQTLFGVLAHMEGEPIKRIVHEHLNRGNGVDLTEILRNNPDLAAEARRQLDKAAFRTRNVKPKPVPPAADEAIEVG